MATEREENPALGWRAVRLALDRPGLLRYQIRALLTAAKGRDLDVMFPMIAEVAEFIAARALVDKEIDRLGRLGRDGPKSRRVGAILEVPSLAWQLDTLLPLVDFMSVGSNDLFQFLFASDRSNPRLSGRYDLLSPPALAFLKNVVDKAEDHDVPLSLCGEMAGDPLEAMVLIGLGFRRISMPPSAVGPVKAMVRTIDSTAIADLVTELLVGPDHSVRDQLMAFAKQHGVAIC
jgi:phosphotransferase system enzyme I (PtsP)